MHPFSLHILPLSSGAGAFTARGLTTGQASGRLA